MNEKTLTLEGKDVEQFLEYDQRELSVDEKKTLKEAHDFYKNHCKA